MIDDPEIEFRLGETCPRGKLTFPVKTMVSEFVGERLRRTANLMGSKPPAEYVRELLSADAVGQYAAMMLKIDPLFADPNPDGDFEAKLAHIASSLKMDVEAYKDYVLRMHVLGNYSVVSMRLCAGSSLVQMRPQDVRGAK